MNDQDYHTHLFVGRASQQKLETKNLPQAYRTKSPAAFPSQHGTKLDDNLYTTPNSQISESNQYRRKQRTLLWPATATPP